MKHFKEKEVNMCEQKHLSTENKNSSSTNLSTSNKNPCCFLIGEDHFIIQCADILIKHNFHVLGVISPFLHVREWCIANQVPVYKSFDEADSVLNEADIDYLFSIVNSKIIPNNILNKAKKIAINYHHSPLPKYAGVNATSWAILNNEEKHGITWHVISDVVDGGDILKQAIFNIDKRETALTLNLKCYQQALVLFNELILDIENNTVKKYPQDLTKRSYYGLNKKPTGNAIIDWNTSGEDIERHFRALYLGAYDNSLGVLKIKISDNYYIVSELKISHLSSGSAPGTINEINSSFWQISTATNDIIVLNLMSQYGNECSLEDLVSLYKIKKGYQLTLIDYHDLNLFESACSEIGKNEQFWISKLTSFEPAEMPFMDKFILTAPSEYALVAEKSMAKKIFSKICAHKNIVDVLLTVWFIYLYRIGNKKNMGVSLNYSGMDQCPAFKNCFSNEIPFFVQFEDGLGFEQAFELVSHHHSIIKNRGTFLKDIFYRYPSLSNISPFIPISIDIEEESDNKTHEIDSNAIVILKISIPNNQLSWYVKKDLLDINENLTNVVKNSAHHFDILVSAIANDFTQPLNTLPILTEHEKQTILFDWNRTQIDYPRDKNISNLLDKSFHEYEAKIAIRQEHLSITYGDLNQRVNNLTNYFLNTMYVKYHDPIIVYMSRGIEWIVSLLAIMKIGAIYIPVVNNTPFKRLQLIINDSKATILLSQEKLIANLENLSSPVKLLDIDSITQTPPITDKVITADFPSHFSAYILYTSGTTGVPKGVVIKHESLVNLIHEQMRRLPIDTNSNVLQFSSIGFDASIWEIFSTFMVGAALCIPSEKTVLIGKALTSTLNSFDITLATLPPSILQTIHPTDIRPTLKTIVTAGESCSRELADLWVTHVCLINAYGPTETTVCATMGIVSENGAINIGKPIANTCAYVLDKNLNLVPEGITGELYIGGDALAMGYLNQPKLTQQYFNANPLSSNLNDRIYRTRDLARWLPEGNLEYMGRVDNQIKIRGLRIEPEAIEAQILHHKDITQCVVSLSQNDTLEKFIVAYLVSENKIDLHHLREYLREHLPHYMIPNFFIMLNELPLTANGKVDRKALPVPELKCNMSAHDYTPPSSPIEKKLCKIWSDILRIEKIGIHNDFFTIGGNSLSLSQLIITLREQFDFEMHFSVILKNPTIAALARVVSKKFNDVIDTDYNLRFLNDTLLEKDVISIPKKTKLKKHTTVLLTGATGFLGSHLLKELYGNKNLRIYCLTRAESDAHAKILIDKTLQKYSFDFSVDDRIIPITGDIASPQIGLSDDVMNSLAKELDEIYHNGAIVHHLYTYEMLRAANVGGTTELLKLASQFKSKKFHYISTLSAMSNFTEKNDHVIEDFLSLDAKAPPENGYNQTKWVSEKLLSEASNRGFSVNIYRPGWILGNTFTSNISIENNHFLSLIKGCVQMGYAPNWNIELNILPVDFLSKIIVNISRSNGCNNKVFNFFNTNKVSWTSLIQFLNEFGCDLQLINKVDWMHLLKKVGQENSLFNLLPLYIGEGNDMERSFNQIKASNDGNVRDAMDHFKTCYPIINKDMLTNFLYFLKK